MKKIKWSTLHLALIGALLTFAACANDDDPFGQNSGLNQNLPFRVMVSTPSFDQRLVPLDSTIKITFNRSVDRSSVSSGMGTLADDQLIWSRNGILLDGATYRIFVSSAVRSTAGETLIGDYELQFTTGDGFGVGSLNDPNNPPTITSVQYQPFPEPGVCNRLRISFNEDLARAPRGTWENKTQDIFFQWSTAGAGDLYAYPAYADSDNTFYVEPPAGGCGLIQGDLNTKLIFRITEAMDNSGNLNTQQWNYEYDEGFLGLGGDF
jgi:hypothetical protein